MKYYRLSHDVVTCDVDRDNLELPNKVIHKSCKNYDISRSKIVCKYRNKDSWQLKISNRQGKLIVRVCLEIILSTSYLLTNFPYLFNLSDSFLQISLTD